MPQVSASFLPSSVETFLSPARSCLVATRTLLTSSVQLLSICVIHFSIFENETGSVMEQTSTMPAAPLQQVWVMFLNRSWPAVSQICNLNILSPIGRDLILKSTPMVATQVSLKWFSQKRVIRLVLPTPLSPITITFTEYMFVFLPSIPQNYYIPEAPLPFIIPGMRSGNRETMSPSPLRKSAAIILLYPGEGGHRTVLLKRKSAMSFGNSYVFPGGACEEGDREMAGSHDFIPYSKMTAIREFLEETGLLVYPRQHEPYIFSRDFLAKSLMEIGADLGEIWSGNLGLVEPVLRLMTPQLPKGKRFDCIFHICKVDQCVGILNVALLKSKTTGTPSASQLAVCARLGSKSPIMFDRNESDGYMFETPARIMEQFREGKVQLIPPQIIIFSCLLRLCSERCRGELAKLCMGSGCTYFGDLEPIMFRFDLRNKRLLIFGDGSYGQQSILENEPESESKSDLRAYISSKGGEARKDGIRQIELKQEVMLTSTYPHWETRQLLSFLIDPQARL